MPTYICEKCGCLDNTICGGNYWNVKFNKNSYKDDYANKHVLCVECCPKEFIDGSISQLAGEWHNQFPKTHWSELGTREELLKTFILNIKEYFEMESNK